MKLKKNSILWSIEHIERYADTDIFPKQIEHKVLYSDKDEISSELANIDLENIKSGQSRKFIVPKDDLSYRIGTQLSYIDNIVLTSIIYEYGNLIENKRIAASENIVFSYRFSPKSDFSLYDNKYSWTLFWTEALKHTKKCDNFLLLDISDFYNQIYHHTVENCLIDSGFPNQVKNWVMKLLENTTSKVSRGIPIGSHSIHILAEAVLNNIDRSLQSRGINFVRYVDDYIVFAKSNTDARRINLVFADILDKQNRLVVQKQKTRILNAVQFKKECAANIEDRPINISEDKLLKIIRKHSNDDPYRLILINDLSSKELLEFDSSVVNEIFDDYINTNEIDYVRLRWFLRRLSQVGHPGGLSYLLDHIDDILPALNDVFKYILSIDKADGESWSNVGDNLLDLANDEITKDVPYYQLIIYSLFNQKQELNHIGVLLSNYDKMPPELQRELIILAFTNDCKDWLRELKEKFQSFDPWNKTAYLVAISRLPKEERKYFINNFSNKDDLTQKLIAKWSSKQ